MFNLNHVISLIIINLLCTYIKAQNDYKIFYYPSGVISSEGILKNGKPDGYWKTYYPNGQLKSEGKRTNYLLDSTWVFYNENGDTSEIINYYFGKKNGYLLKYYTSNGNCIKSKELFVNDSREGLSYYYYLNNHIQKIVPFENNLENGLVKEFNKDSMIISLIEYKRGQIVNTEFINRYNEDNLKDGIWREYFLNGRLKKEIHYKNGLINGTIKEYDIQGNLIKNVLYADNVLMDSSYNDTLSIDLRRVFNEFGNIIKEGSYINNIPIGIHREYNEMKEVVKSIIYDENGHKTAEGIIDEQGRYQGDFIFYYLNGTQKSKGSYLNGRRIGQWLFFYPNSQIEQMGNYKNGYHDGKWIWLYENGNVFREEEYLNGKENGLYIEFYPDSSVIAKGYYSNGIKDGEWFYHVGDHTKKGIYVNDNPEGKWFYYYLDGKIFFEGTFVDGNPDGKHMYYYENGKPKEEQYFNNGSKIRTWKKYDMSGNIIYTITYKNDREIKINGTKIAGNF